MKFAAPAWMKPGIIGGIIGAAGLAIVGFSAGYVVTNSAAQKMAENAKEDAILAALTPICVDQFTQMSAMTKTTELAALKGESSWKRGDYVSASGWATFPGTEKPNDDVADACAVELMKIANEA